MTANFLDTAQDHLQQAAATLPRGLPHIHEVIARDYVVHQVLVAAQLCIARRREVNEASVKTGH
jgi:hypothetical protein